MAVCGTKTLKNGIQFSALFPMRPRQYWVGRGWPTLNDVTHGKKWKSNTGLYCRSSKELRANQFTTFWSTYARVLRLGASYKALNSEKGLDVPRLKVS